MRPQVKPRNAEVLVVALMADLMDDIDCSVRIGVPTGWKKGSRKHLQIRNDGAPVSAWPIASAVTIALIARADTTSEATDLCTEAFGRLCAFEGDGVIVRTAPLLEPVATQDPDTRAEVASATVRVTVRTEPIDLGS